MSIIALIRLLKDRYNCLKGAVELFQAIHLLDPDLSKINAYLDLCLEEDMKSALPERMNRLSSFCCKNWNNFQQCSLVTWIADRHSALPLFTDLLTSIAHNDEFDGYHFVVELIFCYLDAGLSDLLLELLSKLLECPKSVRTVLCSPEIWERLNLDGSLGRAQLVAVLKAFVKKRIAILAVYLEQTSNPTNESFSDFKFQKWSGERYGETNLRVSASFAMDYVVRLLDAADSGLTEFEALAILGPLLSKLSPVKLGQLVVDSLRSKKETAESESLVVRICQQMSLPDRLIPDVAIRLLDTFFSCKGTTSEELLGSLIEALLAKSTPSVFSSVFKEILSEVEIDPSSVSVMKRILSKLKTLWMASVVDKDDVTDAVECIEMFILLKNHCCRPEVSPDVVTPFIPKMTTETLLKLLSLLHSVIDQWNRPPLSEAYHYAQLGRNLIIALLRRPGAKDAVNTFEDVQKMFQCLIWLSDNPCTESFIAVLSATRDGERLAVQLALSIGNQPELADLAIHHPTGLKVSWALLDHCIDGLGRIWKQNGANLPWNFQKVKDFLRSTSQSMVRESFRRIDDAYQYRDRLLKEMENGRVRVTIQVKGQNPRLEIIKIMDEAWQAECSTDWFHYDDRQEKLDTLVALRKDQQIEEAVAASAAGTKRSSDRNSLDSSKAKRAKKFLVIDVD